MARLDLGNHWYVCCFARRNDGTKTNFEFQFWFATRTYLVDSDRYWEMSESRNLKSHRSRVSSTGKFQSNTNCIGFT